VTVSVHGRLGGQEVILFVSASITWM